MSDKSILQKVVLLHQTLEERLVAFYEKPLEEIGSTDDMEIDLGLTQGNEV